MFIAQYVVFAAGQEAQTVGNSGAGFVLMFPSPSFSSHLLLFLNVAPATKHLTQFSKALVCLKSIFNQSATLPRLPIQY